MLDKWNSGVNLFSKRRRVNEQAAIQLLIEGDVQHLVCLEHLAVVPT